MLKTVALNNIFVDYITLIYYIILFYITLYYIILYIAYCTIPSDLSTSFAVFHGIVVLSLIKVFYSYSAKTLWLISELFLFFWLRTISKKCLNEKMNGKNTSGTKASEKVSSHCCALFIPAGGCHNYIIMLSKSMFLYWWPFKVTAFSQHKYLIIL